VRIDSPDPSRPHEGKVLAIVQAHSDDMPIFSAGLVAKLIDEGYTGYLIQTTNDEKCGPTPSIGDTVRRNERDVEKLAEILGLGGIFNLGYRNHRLDEASDLELRCRLIFLFRHLKVDTVMTFNPWGHVEENPDHYVTGRAAEAACWMTGNGKDYPEQVAAVGRHSVRDKYYWTMRPGQPYNLVTDISGYLEQRIAVNAACKAQGPFGEHGRRLKAELAAKGLALPQFGDDDDIADREYIRLFGLEENRLMAEPYGLEHAEYHYYVPPGGYAVRTNVRERIDRFVEEHAAPLQ